MGLYDFKPQFVPAILDGSKRHTIRAERKNPERVGQTMHLYTGLRHPGARLLLRAPCVRVQRINITKRYPGVISIFSIIVDDERLARDEAERLARADGFESLRGMEAFWVGRLPFYGHIIHWDYARAEFGPDATAAAVERQS